MGGASSGGRPIHRDANGNVAPVYRDANGDIAVATLLPGQTLQDFLNSPAANVSSDIPTVGGSSVNPNVGGASGGTSENQNTILNSVVRNQNPFYTSLNEIKSNTGLINDMANMQRSNIENFNTKDQASRTSARDALAQSLITQGQNVFQQGLPQTLEDLNSRHLLNGSGLQQELARQQSYLANNIVNQLGVQGMSDINRSSDISLQGLQNQQGLQQTGLSRGFSLLDFSKQAKLAKEIGAQVAPSVGSGKGNAGTILGGTGSTLGGAAALAKAFK